MTIPRHIFKTYDIRGLVDTDITPEFAYGLGRAFATFIRREIGKETPVIAVGYDMRPSSIPYEAELVKGLVAAGAQVIRMGLLSTPGFYFGVSHVNADGGIQVSASHNPAAYNGFKLVRARAVAISGETGIQAIADIMANDDFDVISLAPDRPHSVSDWPGIPAKQVAAEIAFAEITDLPQFKIVADSANGMGAQYLDLAFSLPPLYKGGERGVSTEANGGGIGGVGAEATGQGGERGVGTDVTRLFWDFDGTFPNHEADPFKAENTEAICHKVKELGADIGITTDGDGDRIFFVDDLGEVVDPAIVRGLVARAMLRRFPGATICYDIRPGKITEDMIREAGGIPQVTRVGHALIKEAMIKSGAVFAGESSGHFYMSMPAGVYEAPVATMLVVLGEMAREGKKLSEIVAPLRRYSHSGEINFKVEDKLGAVARLKSHFADGEQSTLDGLLITYPTFWFNVRTSNTEPVLRLNLEAIDEQTMQNKRDEAARIIAG
ncbi:MAG: phosphomannomutase/phosphoglucomutase [Patescibacteria group bacterium]